MMASSAARVPPFSICSRRASARLTYTDGGEAVREVLGPQISQGELPQIIVPANRWQSACSLGNWTLVGCTVSPAFDFDHFELAPEGWSPGG
jgi:predicted cupin superfamily sugar epimerase